MEASNRLVLVFAGRLMVIQGAGCESSCDICEIAREGIYHGKYC